MSLKKNLCVLTKVLKVDIKSGEIDNFFSVKGENTANQPFCSQISFCFLPQNTV